MIGRILGYSLSSVGSVERYQVPGYQRGHASSLGELAALIRIFLAWHVFNTEAHFETGSVRVHG